MSEKVRPTPSPILRELLVDLERSLGTSDFGIIAQTSVREGNGDIMSVLIQAKETEQVFLYEFAHLPTPDQIDWIDNLGERLIATRATAIYAVSETRFTAKAELAAKRACIGLHEVGKEARNQVLLFSLRNPGHVHEQLPPFLLTQRLRGTPPTRLWFGRAALDVDGQPAFDLLVWAKYNAAEKKLRFYLKKIRVSPNVPPVELNISGKAAPLPKVPKCYAHHLGNCDKPSGEHIISKAILDLLPGRLIHVYAWPGLPEGSTLECGKGKLQSNVLCRHHNSLLSKIDDDARLFFKTLYEGLTGQSGNCRIQLNGMVVEKWLLKVACGIAAASQSEGIMTAAPVEWVDILFGKAAWPPYFCSFWGPRLDDRPRQLGFHVVTRIDNLTGRPITLEMRTMLSTMILALAPFPCPGQRRPPGVVVGDGRTNLEIELRWPSDEANKTRVVWPESTD